MNDRILSKEDILCMQYAGMKTSRIMSPKLTPEEYAEAFETYIDKVESVIFMQEESGVTTLTFQDERFPSQLKRIGSDCPPMIHCLGDMSLLAPKGKRIAIIGARAASPSGMKKAYELGKQFAEEGSIIVSGSVYITLSEDIDPAVSGVHQSIAADGQLGCDVVIRVASIKFNPRSAAGSQFSAVHRQCGGVSMGARTAGLYRNSIAGVRG